MKVISGTLKGRKFEGYDLKGTRPTMSRVKESLFNTIQDKVPGSVVLDLFSGSGNLGLEAVSNGSKLVYFNDKNIKAIKVINENINNFNIKDKSKVLNMDYKKALEYFIKNDIQFDIILLDPPYNMDVNNQILDYVNENKLLNNNGIVVCEYQKMDTSIIYKNLEKIKEKKYGDKYISIYKYVKSNVK